MCVCARLRVCVGDRQLVCVSVCEGKNMRAEWDQQTANTRERQQGSERRRREGRSERQREAGREGRMRVCDEARERESR